MVSNQELVGFTEHDPEDYIIVPLSLFSSYELSNFSSALPLYCHVSMFDQVYHGLKS